jgi:hypothetical protein
MPAFFARPGLSCNAHRAENAKAQPLWPGRSRYASSICERALYSPASAQVERERRGDKYRVDAHHDRTINRWLLSLLGLVPESMPGAHRLHDLLRPLVCRLFGSADLMQKVAVAGVGRLTDGYRPTVLRASPSHGPERCEHPDAQAAPLRDMRIERHAVTVHQNVEPCALGCRHGDPLRAQPRR